MGMRVRGTSWQPGREKAPKPRTRLLDESSGKYVSILGQNAICSRQRTLCIGRIGKGWPLNAHNYLASRLVRPQSLRNQAQNPDRESLPPGARTTSTLTTVQQMKDQLQPPLLGYIFDWWLLCSLSWPNTSIHRWSGEWFLFNSYTSIPRCCLYAATCTSSQLPQ
ncbi:uncharacterized protein PV07_06277 [Cladophialophora immunda]|uniref:Uncharacterized protein n=1 Tax=Cladophialophora immunda TaxID=569365 RepID=A0A0D2CHH7_9EURO|nr:uncharacterized protein PV07_06277 [Cladophialophora immunda]KIW30538.1 hypothetical protein PV07_06277 [Cladophialophora immunda]OQU97196.1 hypothetical protein CLAIMM_03169 [Cladophialophora immunda]